MAGSRFPYLAQKIPLGYDYLANAIADAINQQEEKDHVKVVDYEEKKSEEVLNFDQIRAKAEELWVKLVNDPNLSEEKRLDNLNRINSRIEKIFGRPLKLSEVTENQVDLFNLVVLEMEDLI